MERIQARTDEIGRRLVGLYRREILDYGALGARTIDNDVLGTAVANLETLLECLRGGRRMGRDELVAFQRSGVRRVHQGVSMEALLHAYRVWGQAVWEEVLAVTDRTPAAREAALWIAGELMAYVDTVSVAVAQAYMDEAAGVWSDREVVRRDLLEALISGRASPDVVRRRAGALGITVADAYCVVLARPLDPAGTARDMLRHALHLARERLRPPTGSLLVGLREDEVVALYPLASPVGATELTAQAQGLARQLSSLVVGLGRRHDGVEGIAASYAEAREAAQMALADGAGGHAVAFADVLLDHIVRTSRHSQTLLEDTLVPLRDYDERRSADLVGTLRAYFETGFHLTRAAERLHVHPNTVVYRLQRIHALTGRDPSNPNDLLLLVLGLKMLELGGADPAAGDR